MKRRMVLILTAAIVGLFSISAIAAEGAQERWDGNAPAQGSYYNSERVSVDGTADLSAGGVELKAEDGQVYDLMYPRFLADGVEVKDGDAISVEGYLVPGPRWETSENENHLRVDKVTLNGKEYDLASNFGPRGGTYGPGACWGYGNSGYDSRGGGYGPGAKGSRGGGYSGRSPGMMGGRGFRR